MYAHLKPVISVSFYFLFLQYPRVLLWCLVAPSLYMPLARVGVADNELPFLYEKLFHPFHKGNTDHDMAINHDFKYIRSRNTLQIFFLFFFYKFCPNLLIGGIGEDRAPAKQSLLRWPCPLPSDRAIPVLWQNLELPYII